MTLLDECLGALGDDVDVLETEKSKRVASHLFEMFPLTRWGRIDWDRVPNRVAFETLDELVAVLQTHEKDRDPSMYVVWTDPTLPVIVARLSKVLDALDDVTAVSHDTWLFNPGERYVVEFYHEGEYTVGFISS